MDKQIYLKEISLRDYKCFQGMNIFPFYKDLGKNGKVGIYQWTVFLGNNGTGKTNILKVIANMEPEKAIKSEEVKDLYFDIAVSIGNKQISEDLSKAPQYRPKVVERFPSGNYDVSCGFSYSNQQRELSKKECQDLVRRKTAIPQSNGTVLHTSSPTRIGYGPHQNSVDPTPELADFKIYAYGAHPVFSVADLHRPCMTA